MAPLTDRQFNPSTQNLVDALGSATGDECVACASRLAHACARSAKCTILVADDPAVTSGALAALRTALARACEALRPALPSAIPKETSAQPQLSALKDATALVVLLLPVSRPLREAFRADVDGLVRPCCEFLDLCARHCAAEGHPDGPFALSAFDVAGDIADILSGLCRPRALFARELLARAPFIADTAVWLTGAGWRTETSLLSGKGVHTRPLLALALADHVADTTVSDKCRMAVFGVVDTCALAVCNAARSDVERTVALRTLGPLVGVSHGTKKRVVESHVMFVDAVAAINCDVMLPAALRVAALECLALLCAGTNDYKSVLVRSSDFARGLRVALTCDDETVVKTACCAAACLLFLSPQSSSVLGMSRDAPSIADALARVLLRATDAPSSHGHAYSAAWALCWMSRSRPEMVRNALGATNALASLIALIESGDDLVAPTSPSPIPEENSPHDHWSCLVDMSIRRRHFALRALCCLFRCDCDGVKDLISTTSFLGCLLRRAMSSDWEDRRWSVLLASRIASYAPAARIMADLGFVEVALDMAESAVGMAAESGKPLTSTADDVSYDAGDVSETGTAREEANGAATVHFFSDSREDLFDIVLSGRVSFDIVVLTSRDALMDRVPAVGIALEALYEFSKSELLRPRMAAAGTTDRIAAMAGGGRATLGPIQLLIDAHLASVQLASMRRVSWTDGGGGGGGVGGGVAYDAPASRDSAIPKGETRTEQTMARYGKIIRRLCVYVREIMSGRRSDFVPYMRGFETNAAGCLEALRAVAANDECDRSLQPIVDLLTECLRQRPAAFLALPDVPEQLMGLAWAVAFHKEWHPTLLAADGLVDTLKHYAHMGEGDKTRRNAQGALWALGVRRWDKHGRSPIPSPAVVRSPPLARALARDREREEARSRGYESKESSQHARRSRRRSSSGSKSRSSRLADPVSEAGATPLRRAMDADALPPAAAAESVPEQAPSQSPPSARGAVAPELSPPRARRKQEDVSDAKVLRNISLPSLQPRVLEPLRAKVDTPEISEELGAKATPASAVEVPLVKKKAMQPALKAQKAERVPALAHASAVTEKAADELKAPTEALLTEHASAIAEPVPLQLATDVLPELKKVTEERDVHAAAVPAAVPAPTAAEAPTSGKHCMISYNWTHQTTALRIRDRLVAEGIPVWIDVSDIHGSTLEAMASAVEEAAVVLLLCSSQYQESVACRTEAEYTYTLRRPFIPVVVQRGFHMRTWLGAMVGTRLYHTVLEDMPESEFSAKMEALVREIRPKVAHVLAGALGAMSSFSVGTRSSAHHYSATDVSRRDSSLAVVVAGDENAASDTALSPNGQWNNRTAHGAGSASAQFDASIPVSKWSVAHVGAWLRSVGLGSFVGDFEQQGIGGASLDELYRLVRAGNDQEFGRILREDMGIHSVGVVLEFKARLRALLEGQPAQQPLVQQSRRPLCVCL